MDTQRIIAFIVFSFSTLLLWESWQAYNAPKPAVAIQAGTAKQQAAATAELPPAPGQALKPSAVAVDNTQTVRGARARVVTDVLDAEIDANGR